MNKGVKFKYARIGQASYADQAGGKRITSTVIAAGADVVFGMGDGASFGMLQAVSTAKAPAGAKKVWFIDVIGDKTKIDKKGVLLSSELWDFAPIYTRAIRAVNAGTFGTTYTLDAKQRPLAAEDEQGAGLRLGEGRRCAEEGRQRIGARSSRPPPRRRSRSTARSDR